MRMTYDGGRLGDPKPVLTGIPNGFIHDGGRLLFAPDGTLFVSTGETGEEQLAQDRDSLGGKILRITPTAMPRPGQPVPRVAGVDVGPPQRAGARVRRPGRLWATEFGADTWDELNLIDPGRNYGWPLAEGARRPRRLPRPVRAVAHRRGVAVRAGLPRRVAVGWRRCAGSGCGRCRSPADGTGRPGTGSSATTAGCAPSWWHPTATCGSPPATATAAATRPATTTGSSWSRSTETCFRAALDGAFWEVCPVGTDPRCHDAPVTVNHTGGGPAELRLLDAFDAAAFAVDAGGQVVYANETAERLFGRPGGVLVGETLMTHLFSENEQEALAAVVRQVLGGRPWRGAWTSATPTGPCTRPSSAARRCGGTRWSWACSALWTTPAPSEAPCGRRADWATG